MSDKEALPQTETFAADVTEPNSQARQRFSPRWKIGKHLFKRGRPFPTLPALTLKSLGHVGMAILAVSSALVTASNLNSVQGLERNSQTLFFHIRGPVEPPGFDPAAGEVGVVILAIDSASLAQYSSDSTNTALAPIARWPWQRKAYAIAIDRLMQAEARTVALDLLLDLPSSYGSQDDAQLQRSLEKYPRRVTLASQYVDEELPQGWVIRLMQPQQAFQSHTLEGFINYSMSADGHAHELMREPSQLPLFKANPEVLRTVPQIPSFVEAALKSAQLSYPLPKGQDIHFYGPSKTFTHIPFWEVLDPVFWKNHLENQTFKNKIVLIGGTDLLFQDFHAAPFSGTFQYPEKMAGVEIHANSIATLLENKSIAQLLPNVSLRGLAVCLLIVVAGYLQTRTPRPLRRFAYGLILACAWGAISYAMFVQARFMLPTAVPMAAIMLSSVSYLLTGVASDRLQLIQEAKKRRGSQQIRELLSATQQDDLQLIVQEYDQELIGRKLKNRYIVVKELASGGFGQTYLAQDSDRPGNPTCVVKRLRPASDKPSVMKLAEVLFAREAVIQELLGRHDQIPQLLAYFNEKDDFYLVQEYIEGKSLAEEFAMRSLLKPISEYKVILTIYELLQILDFVHQHGVIHRDIKPANVIRRRLDGKLVLIDFGAVKQISQLEDTPAATAFTVAIGTNGYMAPEQAAGRPSAASDIYSLGIMGIQALTGISAGELDKKRDPDSQELQWKDSVQISHSFAKVLDKMVQPNLNDRYRSVKDVLADLQLLAEYARQTSADAERHENLQSSDDTDAQLVDETQPWPQTSDLIHPNLSDADVTDATAQFEGGLESLIGSSTDPLDSKNAPLLDLPETDALPTDWDDRPEK